MIRQCEETGAWFNIKMPSYQHRKSHCGDKTILWPSYLFIGISYSGKMTSLYWIRAQVTCSRQGTALFCPTYSVACMWSQSQSKFICVGGSGRFEGWFYCRIFCWFRKGKSEKNLMVRFLTNRSWIKEGWPKKRPLILNIYIYIYHTLTLQGIISTPQCIFFNSPQHKV